MATWRALVVVWLLVSSGCASIAQTCEKPAAFGGVRALGSFAATVLDDLGDGEMKGSDALIVVPASLLALIDLPLSLALDVLLLPYTAPAEVAAGGVDVSIVRLMFDY